MSGEIPLEERIAYSQFCRCANKPGSNVVKGFECPLWKDSNGRFDLDSYSVINFPAVAVCLTCVSRDKMNQLKVSQEKLDDEAAKSPYAILLNPDYGLHEELKHFLELSDYKDRSNAGISWYRIYKIILNSYDCYDLMNDEEYSEKIRNRRCQIEDRILTI